MNLTNRQEFLDWFDRSVDRSSLEVFAHAKRHLIAEVDEVPSDVFRGREYEVVGRLDELLSRSDAESALWGRVCIDLWFCSNFGGPHWTELVARDPANVRHAIEAAYWVFQVSGKAGGQALAAILNQCKCWSVAEECIAPQPEDQQRGWWEMWVAPYRE